MDSKNLRVVPYPSTVASESDRKSVGRLIARRRTQLGLSQRALGERAGISRVMIAAIENGSTHVPWKRAPQLAKVLELDSNEILRPEDQDDGWVQLWTMWEQLDLAGKNVMKTVMQELIARQQAGTPESSGNHS